MKNKTMKIFVKESKEHPSFTKKQVLQIVKDHTKIVRRWIFMPKSLKFKKLLKKTKEYYGAKKGTQVAYALGNKLGWRVWKKRLKTSQTWLKLGLWLV